jgi:hypothetical protein
MNKQHDYALAAVGASSLQRHGDRIQHRAIPPCSLAPRRTVTPYPLELLSADGWPRGRRMMGMPHARGAPHSSKLAT